MTKNIKKVSDQAFLDILNSDKGYQDARESLLKHGLRLKPKFKSAKKNNPDNQEE